jgi:hypothetical protein
MRRVLPALPTLGLALLLLIVGFVYLIPGINQPVNIYDEGIIAYSAVRVMDGHVPYRDFWSIYSPAQFYVLALAFKLFGITIMVERVWDTLTRALLAMFVFLLVTRLTSRKLAVLAWGMVLVWLGFYSYSYQFQWVFYGYPAFPAIAGGLASIWLLTFCFERPQRRWLVASGVALGITALFRHDFGIYCGAGQVIALAAYVVLRAAAPRRAIALLRPVVDTLWPFALGAAVIVAPVALYFLLQAGPAELIYDLFSFPAVIFPRFRRLPFPALDLPDNLPFYLPFVVFALAAAVAVVMARRRTLAGLTYALSILMLIVFGAFAFNQARVRADVIHTPAFFIPALMLVAVLLRGIPHEKIEKDEKGGKADQNIADAARVFSALAVLMVVLVLPQPVGDRIDLLSDPKRLSPFISHGLARAKTALVNPDMVQAVRYIQANTGPDERIYVGNATHDRVFVNEPMFYFLAARHSATRYHELHPGVATTAPVQTEIVSDLEKGRVRYLVLTSAFEQVREPNESAVSSNVKILDDYIHQHFLPAMQFGPYTIWRRV